MPDPMTQTFAPLIMAERGRIITVGSIAGIQANPGAGIYNMSKAAMEAFTDTLAAEMQPHGVSVSIIEPGSYRTNIFKTAAERAGESSSADVSKLKEAD